jgi:hypothetical protein
VKAWASCWLVIVVLTVTSISAAAQQPAKAFRVGVLSPAERCNRDRAIRCGKPQTSSLSFRSARCHSDPFPIPPAGPILQPVVPRDPPYPPYVFFAPGAVAPTTDVEALSGSPLPSGYAGLIIQLNQDSARHWSGGVGTANISIPVPTVSTLRFGIFQGRRPRPRAEYGLDMRYLYPGTPLRAQSGNHENRPIRARFRSAAGGLNAIAMGYRAAVLEVRSPLRT